jgi:HD domain-containing protein
MAATYEELVSTPAELEALAALRSATGLENGAMERHCLRTLRIAEAIAEQRGWPIDLEVLVVASLLHDIGLYREVSTKGVYVEEGAIFAGEMLGRHGWDEDRRRRCMDAIERHHETRNQLERGGEVEALRRADLTEVTLGRVRHGLSKDWMDRLRKEVPTDGLVSELAREVGRNLLTRPLSMARIFRR